MDNIYTDQELGNIDIIERLFYEVWNQKQIEVIDDIMSADIVIHMEYKDIFGIDGWKKDLFYPITTAISDLVLEIKDICSKSSNVITNWRAQGIHRGVLFDVQPTEERVEFSGITWAKIDSGKVAEITNNWNISCFFHHLYIENKTLRGILPICAHCKKIRDSEGLWRQLEEYIHSHSKVDFSHSICPECIKKLYQDE